MDIRPSWIGPLSRLCPEVRVLVTLGIGRRSDNPLTSHPGTWGRVIRASSHSHSDVVAESGFMFPYWPTLLEWPAVTYGYEPESRRVTQVTASIRLSKDALYVQKFFNKEHTSNAWGQIDLWIPDVPLEHAVTICAGPVTSIEFDSPNSAVGLTIQDSYDGHPREFPFNNNFLNKNEFPQISEELDGRARRIFLLNELRDFIPCVPISRDMTEYYVCEPPMPQMPTQAWVGTERVQRGQFRFRRGRMAATGTEFTKLTFSDRIEKLGYTGVVKANGGTGPNTENPLRFFLDRIPNLQLTARATAYLHDLDRRGLFDYYVIINNNGNVIDLILNRLLPMSDLIGFFRNGKLDIIRQGESTRIQTLTMYSELAHRLPAMPTETAMDSVINAVDVRYRRNFQPATTSFSRYAVTVDKLYGGTFGMHLARSEELYGRRFLEIDASDLSNAHDAERLGISFLKQTAFQHRIYRYHMSYRYGLGLDINDRVKLNDPFMQLEDTNCRVIGIQFLPTGMNVNFQTEDNDEGF